MFPAKSGAKHSTFIVGRRRLIARIVSEMWFDPPSDKSSLKIKI
jgi:hypothetical protein